MIHPRETIISLHEVDKVYCLYRRQLDRIRAALWPSSRVSCRKFYALSGISLDIAPGETVGIIGRNGSGKSTLLQIICSILRPSCGTVRVNGRIAALLELGAGFNPEFTGRENVYLNGSILGLSRKEIDACFADIESFAGIADFIDRPVKTYSSGMYVRLAFSVAINVHPDILIVDEALSVGDALFQAKCFARFRKFQEEGVTILFVTHSMDLVTRYCSRALLLERGRLSRDGGAKEVVDAYNRLLVEKEMPSAGKGHLTRDEAVTETPETELPVSGMGNEHDFRLNPEENRYGSGKAEIIRVGIYGIDGRPQQAVRHGEFFDIIMDVQAHTDLRNPIFAFTIKDVKGFDLTGTNTFFHNIDTETMTTGEVVRVIFRQKMSLNSGSYLLSFGCAVFEDGEYVVHDRRYDLMTIEVISDHQSVGFFDMNSEISYYRLPRPEKIDK